MSTPSLSASEWTHVRNNASDKWLFVLYLFFFSCLASVAFALPPQKLLINKAEIGIHDTTAFIDLSLALDNEEGLRALLKDGAVLDLAVSISVQRERSWWANANVVHQDYSSIIRHEPLSRDFIVTIPTETGEKEIRDRNLTRLLHASWRQLHLPVAQLDDIVGEGDAEDSYTVLLSISLQHIEVPPWLEKSTVFWSSQVVPKEKREFAFNPAVK